MEWQYVNFKDESWYLPDTKNDTSQLIPLIDEALVILKERFKTKSGKWVFPSNSSKSGHLEEPKKVWYKIRQRATCKMWLSNSSLQELINKATKSVSKKMNHLYLFNLIKNQAAKDNVTIPTGILDVRLHDLRRTMGSWLAHSGANQFIIGKSLNHKSTKSTAVYARLSIDPVRESMGEAVRMMQGKRKNY